MQIPDFIEVLSSNLLCIFPEKIHLISPATTLPFNPVRLVSLVIWVYICLYFVQRVQYSPLVPIKYRSIVYLITLFTGPVLLFILFVLDAVKKSRYSDKSAIQTIIQQIQNAVVKIRSRSHSLRKEDLSIKLLDSSGRSINEIYGHGDHKGQDRGILDLTEKIISDALERRASDNLIDPKDEATTQ